MHDSLRDLLRRRAAEAGGASPDLAERSLRRARVIARRRIAAAASAAVAFVAIAGTAASALVLPDDTVPSAEDPITTVPDEPDDATTSAESAAECGRPSADWSGWGDSDSMGPLTELPESLYAQLDWSGGSLTQVWRYDRGDSDYFVEGSDFVIEHEIGSISAAPDGNRYIISMECSSWIGTVDESGDSIEDLGIDSLFCDPVWSPDSNSVAVTVPSPEYDERYLLDVATGEQTDLPDEVSCEPRWSGDGEYLVRSDGTFAIRPDGSGRTELQAPSTDEGELASLSSISADLERACFQIDTDADAGSGHVDPIRCDRYVDTETGAELELPLEAEGAQVVFLADGGMIISELTDQGIELALFDADGQNLDSRILDHRDAESAVLTGYYTD